jgi:hypothetical protein
MTHTESTPTADLARAWLQDAIADRPEGAYEGRFFAGEVPIFEYLLSLLPDVDFTPAPDASQVPYENVGGVFVDPSESLTWCPECNEDHGDEQPASQPTPFDERVLDDTDAIIDMTSAFVTSTAAILAIRAHVEYRVGQAQAHWKAVQHGKRGESWATARGVAAELATLLAEIDAVIGARLH